MFYAFLKAIHLLCVMVWVGGMVFAHYFLRPALSELAAPERLRLMQQVLGRFFNAVLVACLLTLGTGWWMMLRALGSAGQAGVKVAMPLEWTLMAALGMLMIVIFGYIRLALYPVFTRAVAAAAWPAAAAALGRIRTLVLANLVLGVVTVLVTLLGAAG